MTNACQSNNNYSCSRLFMFYAVGIVLPVDELYESFIYIFCLKNVHSHIYADAFIQEIHHIMIMIYMAKQNICNQNVSQLKDRSFSALCIFPTLILNYFL